MPAALQIIALLRYASAPVPSDTMTPNFLYSIGLPATNITESIPMSQNSSRPDVVDAEIIEVADSEAIRSMKTYSMIVYGMYVLGLFLGGLPTVIGLVMAYVKRSNFGDTIYSEHMSLLIRTFWYSLLFSILGAMTAWLYIGIPVLFAVAVWYIYRLVRGFARLTDGKGAW